MSSPRETLFGNRSLDRFDAIIIGSGPSGSTAAGLLCKLGKRVLVLEAGGNYYRGLDDPRPGYPQTLLGSDEIKNSRWLLGSSPYLNPRSYRTDAASPSAGPGSHLELPRGVGGGSMLADARLPRFAPQDFQFGTLLKGQITGTSYADWPIGYDELEPFYSYLEQSVGLQGEVDPHGGKRSVGYPMTPGPAKYVSNLLADAARKRGFQPFRCPRGVNSRPFGGRPACVNCGHCAGFGCPINARGGSSAVTSLRGALLSGNCLLMSETRVLRLLIGSKREVEGVEVTRSDGSRQILRADTYLLATGSIEDARLVLISDSEGVANRSDMVGRNFCGRYLTVVVGIFEHRVHQDRGNGASFSMTDLRGVAGDPSRPIGGLVTLGGEQTPLGEAALYLNNLKVQPGPLLKKAMRQGIGRERMAYMTMYGEDPPQATNRVDLDPQLRDLNGLPGARITYRRHGYGAAVSQQYGPRLLELMELAGARYGAILPLDDEGGQCGHYGGTLRFGADPASSVCDPTGRFHEIGNLYGLGGSLFASLPGYNPTLSMMALSLRVAAGLVYPTSPERGLD